MYSIHMMYISNTHTYIYIYIYRRICHCRAFHCRCLVSGGDQPVMNLGEANLI